jgi:tetratricopeptide (TPR) repeat protein
MHLWGADIRPREWRGLAYQAWGAHLRGDRDAAGVGFRQAEQAQREDETKKDLKHLCDLWGGWHADHLRRVGDADYAWLITEENLEFSKRERLPETIAQCHRIIGDLDADRGDHDSARQHYDEAISVVRRITHQQMLIEALWGRGRWAAARGDVDTARQDLEEAFHYADAGGYRIFEADIRVGLARMHLAAGDEPAARAEAERAERMSTEMGYHWGRTDAAEVLSLLSPGSN